MSPSIHFNHANASPTSGHPAALTPSHPANMHAGAGAARLPEAAHLRSASDDPLFRPYSAGPRVGRRGAGAYDDLALPNPYAAGAEIRRYGSVPHMRSAGYGYEYRAPSATAADDPRWRAAVLQAAAAAAGRG